MTEERSNIPAFEECMADSGSNRGAWQSKSGAKGQSRLPVSQRPTLDQKDKKEAQPGSKSAIGRTLGAVRERTSPWPISEAAQHPYTNSAPVLEEHTPANGFSAKAVEAAMKTPVEPQPLIYKPIEKSAIGGRSGSAPWGSKPNCMANGKDFWVELRKQYTALQRSAGTREGG